ncbi:MAG: ABC transporter permease [Cyanobacteria bacterium]|nr:ABC transporter permease [Cyanobacteriota bacterium]
MMSTIEKNLVFASAIILVLLLIMSLGVFFLGTNPDLDPAFIHPDIALRPPGDTVHWFGTDDLGRDLMSRVAVGAQISLSVGLLTALLSVGIGTVVGLLASFHEGLWDTVLMRAVDVLYSLPGLMIVILVSLFLGRGVVSLVTALAVFSWPETARLIRGQTLSLKREEFIEASHSLGISPLRQALRHILPNLAALIVLSATITIPRAILTESTLSFIGLGVEPPLSSWGTLASEGWQLVRIAPHLLIIPSLFIVSSMIAFNILGERLRKSYNPKST